VLIAFFAFLHEISNFLTRDIWIEIGMNMLIYSFVILLKNK
jgi:hypothetical protein